MAQLRTTVYVQDPDSRQTITLDAGTSPEPRLAALVTNPAAWVDGKLPRLPKAKTDPQDPGPGEQNPPGGGPAAGSGDTSAGSTAADTSDNKAAEAATKTAAKKTAAKTPARGRTAAAEGTGGQ